METDKATVGFEFQDEAELAKIFVEAGGAKIPISPHMAIAVAEVDDLALLVAAGAAGQEHTPGARRLDLRRQKQRCGAGRLRVGGVPGLGVCLGETLSAEVCPPNSWEGQYWRLLWLGVQSLTRASHQFSGGHGVVCGCADVPLPSARNSSSALLLSLASILGTLVSARSCAASAAAARQLCVVYLCVPRFRERRAPGS